MTMIQARYFGPAFKSGWPRQIVVHSVESEIRRGIARSLAQGWFRNPTNQTSAHGIADPAEHIDMVPTTQQAWHCGRGNATSIGREHVGRASFTKAQWTTPDALAMLRLAAAADARDCKKFGIPVRWLSLTQLARDEKGFCTHNDMRLVRGGTTHSDPGPNFPYELYLQFVNEALNPPEDDMPTIKDITDAIRPVIAQEVDKAVRKLLVDEKLVAYSDQRLRPAKDSKRSIVDTLSRDSGYNSNASGGVDQLARAQGLEPEDRK